MKNDYQKILNFLISSRKEGEGRRPMHFYPDYLVAKVWSDVGKEIGIDVGFVSDCQKHYASFYTFHPQKANFSAIIKRARNGRLLERLAVRLSGALKIGPVLSSIEYGRQSGRQLESILRRYYFACEEMYMVSCILRCLDRALIQYLGSLDISRTKKEKIIELGSLGDRPSHVFVESWELEKIAREAKRRNWSLNGVEIKSELEKIFSRYRWLSGGNYKEKVKTILDYRREIKKIIGGNFDSKLMTARKQRERQKIARNNFLIGLGKNEKFILKTISRAATLKDDFKLSINKTLGNSEGLFEELSRRTGQPTDFLKALFPYELYGILKSPRIKKEGIAARGNNHIFLAYDGQVSLLLGKEAAEFRKKYLSVALEDSKQFKGRIACRGHALGKARIILGRKDFDKFRSGMILVTNNTTPDYVPIMKKALAIIAEEGGLTAHVSVVSREFGIPCIVGLRDITKMVKNGDDLEVDANKGIVKIII